MTVPRLAQWATLALVASALSACEAKIDGDMASSPGMPAPGFPSGGASPGLGAGGATAAGGAESARPLELSSGIPAADSCRSGSPGPRKLRRLTAGQFRATVETLFADAAAPNATIFSDPEVLGFTADADMLVVQGLTAQQLADYAERVASWAVKTKLEQLADCRDMTDQCRRGFVEKFGRRAFREPLPAARVDAYAALMAAEPDFSAAAEAAIAAMLQSPYFLYRRELGPESAGNGSVTLTPFEVASSLSYLLVGSMPDETLLAAAQDGSLAMPSVLEQQAQRLLADPRAKQAVMGFFRGWLGLDRLNTTVKDNSVFELTDELRSAMRGESEAFLMNLFDGGGTVSELFSASHSYLNAPLASFYGISPAGASLGTAHTRVEYDSTPRAPGLLGQASLLAGYADAAISSPVKRGKFVLTRLLCRQLPPPPANVNTQLPLPTATETTRQHFEAHVKDPMCAGCHKLMDPIGFAFENYDAFGRYREQENGSPIDASGHTLGLPEGDATFNGLRELSSFLASDDAVNSCVVRFWSYYAYGQASWREDGCTYDAIATTAGVQPKLRDVLLGIIKAPRFTTRSDL